MKFESRERRMIGTYPFKYTYTDPSKFFAPEKAALYVHVPFCVKKCDYCTYVTTVGSAGEERQRYVDALCQEIRRFPEIACYPAYSVEALYFGGGTPSLLTPRQIESVLDACRETFRFLPGAELCMEFDPSTVSEETLRRVKDFGFGRISFGVQAFNDTVLRACNRSHSAAEAISAIELAKRLDFTNFNIDLIYPLPHLTMADWEHSLREAIRFEPAAITAHVLEVWPKTRFARLVQERGYRLPSFKEELEMTNRAYDVLEASGFRRWSTCGYYDPLKTDHYCRFMDYYWKSLPMIGFGVSAKTLLGSRAYTNVSAIGKYVDKVARGESPLDFSVTLTKKQEMLRVLIRGLKVCVVSKAHFVERFGVSMDLVFAEELDYLVRKGWIENGPDRIELTRSGQVNDRSVYAVFYTEDDLRAPREDEVMFGLSMDVEGELSSACTGVPGAGGGVRPQG